MKRFVWFVLGVMMMMSLPSPAGAALSITISEPVFFASGTAELDGTTKRVLDRVSKVMAAPSSTESGLIIYGHTNRKEVPGEQESLALGEKRALAVRDYLVSKGLKTERIKTWSCGWPARSDPTSDGSPKKRRAVIVLDVYIFSRQYQKDILEGYVKEWPLILGC